MDQALAIVLTTVSSDEEAESLSDILIKSKYVACINILTNIKSKYIWKGKLQSVNEVILIIKTKRDYFKYLEKIIKKNHSYQVPEIACIDITDVSTEYGNWIINDLSMREDK